MFDQGFQVHVWVYNLSMRQTTKIFNIKYHLTAMSHPHTDIDIDQHLLIILVYV